MAGHPKKYSWWYYNAITRAVEQVPVGSVPVLEPHFYEDSFGGGFENEEDEMDDEAAGGGFVDSFGTQAARGDGDEAEA